MSTVPWLIEKGLEELPNDLRLFGEGKPDSLVRQTLETLWAEAQERGAAPRKLFRHIVQSQGDKVLKRLQAKQAEGATMTEVQYRHQIYEYRAALEMTDPSLLHAIWTWVDDRTRFADGRKLSDVEPAPLGCELHVWPLGRVVFLYGEETLGQWGKQLLEREAKPMAQAIDELRDGLQMPELGAMLDDAGT